MTTTKDGLTEGFFSEGKRHSCNVYEDGKKVTEKIDIGCRVSERVNRPLSFQNEINMGQGKESELKAINQSGPTKVGPMVSPTKCQFLAMGKVSTGQQSSMDLSLEDGSIEPMSHPSLIKKKSGTQPSPFKPKDKSLLSPSTKVHNKWKKRVHQGGLPLTSIT